MSVLQICAYGAEYPGNFIASLFVLEKILEKKGITTIYAFPEKAKDKKWCREIEQRTKVYYLPEAKARVLPKTYKILKQIYKENEVHIVHSHFELYDMPATIMAPDKVKIFWHLHDPIKKEGGLRNILWSIQYGVVGKKAKLLAVSDYYRKIVVAMGFPENRTKIILNGIDLSRIVPKERNEKKTINFLTFGWDFYRKGDDLILKACDRLDKEGYEFKLLLNGNDLTWSELELFLNGKLPKYLVKSNPVKDVNKLFDCAEVFLQASRRETFSYAVCEAAYAGLPVICSDIEGLEWAHELASVQFFGNEDWEQLYKLMKTWLDNKTINYEDIYESQKHIKSNYSLEVWANKVVESYEE